MPLTVSFLIFGSVLIPKANADVIPQEGWYVSAYDVTLNGKKYYAIDNKTEHYSVWPFYTETTIRTVSESEWNKYGVPYKITGSYWHGWSENGWHIDDDWIICVRLLDVELSKNGVRDNTLSFGLCGVDGSRVPSFSSGLETQANPNSYGFVDVNDVHDMYFHTLHYSPLEYYHSSNNNSPKHFFVSPKDVGFNYDLNLFGTDNSISGADINQLYLFGAVYPDASFLGPPDFSNPSTYTCRMKFGLYFMIPQDKAPKGVVKAGSWPVLQTVPVQPVGFLDKVQDSVSGQLIKIGGLNAASDVIKKQNEYNGLLNGALDLQSSDFTAVAGAIGPQLQSVPFFTTIVPIGVAAIFIIIFVKRGMG